MHLASALCPMCTLAACYALGPDSTASGSICYNILKHAIPLTELVTNTLSPQLSRKELGKNDQDTVHLPLWMRWCPFSMDVSFPLRKPWFSPLFIKRCPKAGSSQLHPPLWNWENNFSQRIVPAGRWWGLLECITLLNNTKVIFPYKRYCAILPKWYNRVKMAT